MNETSFETKTLLTQKLKDLKQAKLTGKLKIKSIFVRA